MAKQEIIGIDVACMRCGVERARWILIGLLLCDNCVSKV
jgi:hypothetical protein